MLKSESIINLSKALVLAQAELKPALKTSENPFFKSHYADLESVWEACREALNRHGLGVIQTLDVNCLETMLVHVSGEFVAGRQALGPKDDTPQGVGSAITYARRYGLAAMVGIIQTDDDGNAASGKSIQTQRATPTGQDNQQAPRTAPPQRQEAKIEPSADVSQSNKPLFPGSKPVSNKTDKAYIEMGDGGMAVITGNLTEVGPEKITKTGKPYIQLRVCDTPVNVFDPSLFEICKNYVTFDVKAFVTVKKTDRGAFYNLTAILPAKQPSGGMPKEQQAPADDIPWPSDENEPVPF